MISHEIVTMKRLILYFECVLYSLLLIACDGFAVGRQSGSTAEGNQSGSAAIEGEEGPTTPAQPTRRATATPAIVATEPAAAASAATKPGPTATSTAPAESAAHARGVGETLILSGCFDFDGGVNVIPPDSAGDFTMLPGPDSDTVEVYPVETAQMAYGGVFPQRPSRAQCEASDAFSGDREVVAPMAARYVCYRTGEGRTGYLHFTGADLEQAGTVMFDWMTFAQEGGDDATGASDLIYSNIAGAHYCCPAP